MAGKSGRTIDATVNTTWKNRIFSWEGMLLLLFFVINIFCRCISPNYTIINVLREMPKYLCEIFLLFPMAYILILGDIVRLLQSSARNLPLSNVWCRRQRKTAWQLMLLRGEKQSPFWLWKIVRWCFQHYCRKPLQVVHRAVLKQRQLRS